MLLQNINSNKFENNCQSDIINLLTDINTIGRAFERLKNLVFDQL